MSATESETLSDAFFALRVLSMYVRETDPIRRKALPLLSALNYADKVLARRPAAAPVRRKVLRRP